MTLNKKQVKFFQARLNLILGVKMSVDGGYGPITKSYVRMFQERVGLTADGIIGRLTAQKINESYNMIGKAKLGPLPFDEERFVVFVDAGHGSFDKNGKPVTKGKRARHKGTTIHIGPNYYEGFENRLIAERFIYECSKIGIMCIRTYHPFKDTPLSERSEIVRSWLDRGYYGYLHSFHSNAISVSKNTPEKLENTIGFCVFTTLENNFSDQIATQHFQNAKNVIGADNWRFLKQDYRDNDEDYEANFQILRETNLKKFKFFGSILEEWGFHTSKKDTLFITKPENRVKRVQTALLTASWVNEELDKMKRETKIA